MFRLRVLAFPLLCWGAAIIDLAAADSPVGYLHSQGSGIKARWRSHYLTQPPSPSTDRQRMALSLGILLTEADLILQATDAQQFRNNSQELIAACRALGLGERIVPRLMTQAQMAQQGDWIQLQGDLRDCHQQLLELFRGQQDRDLAGFVECGSWLRLMEIMLKVMAQDQPGDAQRKLLADATQQARQHFARTLSTLGPQAAAGTVARLLAQLGSRLGPEQAAATLQEGIDRALLNSGATAAPDGAARR